MKKKLLALIVALVVALTCSLAFTACKDNDLNENETNNGETNNGENEEDNSSDEETDTEQTEDNTVEMTKDEIKKALEYTLELKNVTLTFISDKLCVYEIDLTDAVVYYSAFEATDNTIIEERYTSDNKDYKKTDNLWQIQQQSTLLNEAEQTMKSPILDLIYVFDELEWNLDIEDDVYTFSYFDEAVGDVSFEGGFVKQINISYLFDDVEESYIYDKINATTVTEPEDLFGYSKDGKMYVSVFYPDGIPVNGLTDGYSDIVPDLPAIVQIQFVTVLKDGTLGAALIPQGLDENGQITIDIQFILDVFADFDDVIGFGIHILSVASLGYLRGDGGEYGIFTEGTFPQYLFITLMEA